MAVQFIVRWTETASLNPMRIRRGDIIEQYPGGTITDVMNNANQRLGEISDMSFEDLTGVATIGDEERKRINYLDIDALPQNLQDDLENNVAVVTQAEIMPFFKERVL